jgi:putative membrane protein
MTAEHAFDPRTITRPEPALLKYYFITSLFALIAFPIAFLPRLFKYETLRYSFDDEGVSMTWGFVFRKEIYLTYRRIQDIHVTRNLIQRWLGLADVAVQTASGGGEVEMVIEGVREPDRLRDFLYSNMRGARGRESGDRPVAEETGAADDDDVTQLLREIRDSLRARAARAEHG